MAEDGRPTVTVDIESGGVTIDGRPPSGCTQAEVMVDLATSAKMVAASDMPDAVKVEMIMGIRRAFLNDGTWADDVPTFRRRRHEMAEAVSTPLLDLLAARSVAAARSGRVAMRAAFALATACLALSAAAAVLPSLGMPGAQACSAVSAVAMVAAAFAAGRGSSWPPSRRRG